MYPLVEQMTTTTDESTLTLLLANRCVKHLQLLEKRLRLVHPWVSTKRDEEGLSFLACSEYRYYSIEKRR
jgi:hypothetical protein